MSVAKSARSTSRILLELGDVARLTLNRPARANALDWAMGVEFEAAVRQIATEPSVRVLVVRGAGPHFCAGGDFDFIAENTALARAEVEARMLRFYQMYLSILNAPVPTLAAIQGSAMGAGLCLALACDVRIGCRSARVGANFVRIGLHPGMGASALLPHVAGSTRAAELLLGGDSLDGDAAAAAGLLTRAVPDASLDVDVERTARALLGAAPLAQRQAVETLRAPLRERLALTLPREAACQAEDFSSDDVRQAVARFQSRARRGAGSA